MSDSVTGDQSEPEKAEMDTWDAGEPDANDLEKLDGVRITDEYDLTDDIVEEQELQDEDFNAEDKFQDDQIGDWADEDAEKSEDSKDGNTGIDEWTMENAYQSIDGNYNNENGKIMMITVERLGQSDSMGVSSEDVEDINSTKKQPPESDSKKEASEEANDGNVKLKEKSELLEHEQILIQDLKESEIKEEVPSYELEETGDEQTFLEEIDDEASTGESEESYDEKTFLRETDQETSIDELKEIDEGEQEDADSERQKSIFEKSKPTGTQGEGDKANNTPNSGTMGFKENENTQEKHTSKGQKSSSIESVANVNIPRADMKSNRLEMFDRNTKTVLAACDYVYVEWFRFGRLSSAIFCVCTILMVRYLRPAKKRFLQFSIVCFVVVFGSVTLLRNHCTGNKLK
jgi:hypothetical protein